VLFSVIAMMMALIGVVESVVAVESLMLLVLTVVVEQVMAIHIIIIMNEHDCKKKNRI
jgi:hypothetical protein